MISATPPTHSAPTAPHPPLAQAPPASPSAILTPSTIATGTPALQRVEVVGLPGVQMPWHQAFEAAKLLSQGASAAVAVTLEANEEGKEVFVVRSLEQHTTSTVMPDREPDVTPFVLEGTPANGFAKLATFAIGPHVEAIVDGDVVFLSDN